MTKTAKRIALWAPLGLALLVGLWVAFRPQAVPVDMVTAAEGPLVVTVDEEGETRVRDIFVLSAPVGGRALRIDLDVGDPVVAQETIVAEIEPIDPSFMDVRTEAQARAAVQAAEAAMALAEAQLTRASADLKFATSELQRARELVKNRTISERALDEAERAFAEARANVATAEAGLRVREFELKRARAQLLSPTEARRDAAACPCIPLYPPVSGSILAVFHESEGVVEAGMPLVSIGDPRDLEIVADFLTTDAVRIEAGQRVIIEDWGGDRPLAGRVRRVEPTGFTKISALGIEEQRVNVIVDFDDDPALWTRLGHGFRVELRVVLWQTDETLTLPVGALFRDGRRWAVFAVQGGRAALRHVEIGRRNGLEAQVLSGLEAGDRVVLHPSDRVRDGVRIVEREL